MFKLKKNCLALALMVLMVLCGVTQAAVRGLICYGNNPQTDQFNGDTLLGVQKAEKEYGSELLISSFIAKKSELKKEDIPQLEKKLDFVIGVGDNYSGILAQEAEKHPHTKYVVIDSYATTQLKNFKVVQFNNRELGYLAGIVAAAASQTGKVGFIGGEKENPAISEMLSGYNKGVVAINPQCLVLPKWVGSFNKPKKLTGLANGLYQAKTDVIFVPAGNSSLGIFAAAQKNKKMFIGCDGDISKITPKEAQQYVLASVTKSLEDAAFGNIQHIMEGKFQPGVQYRTYADKGVGCIKGSASDLLWEKPSQALLDFEAQTDLQQEDAFLKEGSVKK